MEKESTVMSDYIKENLEALAKLETDSLDYAETESVIYLSLYVSDVYISITPRVFDEEPSEYIELNERDLKIDNFFFRRCAYAEVKTDNDWIPYLQVFLTKEEAEAHLGEAKDVAKVPFKSLLSKAMINDPVAQGLIIDPANKNYLLISKYEFKAIEKFVNSLVKIK